MVTSDYFSDFFELDHLRSTTSVSVIRKLKAHFARHTRTASYRQRVQFSSNDFLKFSNEWDSDHRTSSPCRSQSNGKAESAVKEARKILLRCKKAGSDAFLARPAERLLIRTTRNMIFYPRLLVYFINRL